MTKALRRKDDMGLARTIDWISEWHGDSSNLVIEQTSLNCPCVRTFKRSKLRRLGAMQKRNESPLHTYIKFCAWVILHDAAQDHGSVAWECIYYTPGVDYMITEINEFGVKRHHEVNKAHVLFDNDAGFPLSYGRSYRVDVRSFDTVAEIGGTHPMNLVTPLLDGLATQTIWIPYPPSVRPGDFSLRRGGLGSLAAYSIRMAE